MAVAAIGFVLSDNCVDQANRGSEQVNTVRRCRRNPRCNRASHCVVCTYATYASAVCYRNFVRPPVRLLHFNRVAILVVAIAVSLKYAAKKNKPTFLLTCTSFKF